MTDTKPPQNPMDSDESRFGDLIRDLRELPRADAPPGFVLGLHARLEATAPRPSKWHSLLLWFRSSPRRVPVFALSAAGMVCVAVIGAVLYRSGVMDADLAPATQGLGTINGNGSSSESLSTEPLVHESRDFPTRDNRLEAPPEQEYRRVVRGTRTPADTRTPTAAPAVVPTPEPGIEMQRGAQDAATEQAAPEPKETVPAGAPAMDGKQLRKEDERGRSALRSLDTLRAKAAQDSAQDSARRAAPTLLPAPVQLPAPVRPADSARPR